MIAEIRDYIRQAVKEGSPEMKEHDSAFYTGDIPETIIDRSFHISINNLVKSFRTEYTEREMGVVVSIFGHGYKKEVMNYDYLLDRAICIEDTILSIKRLTSVATIVNIRSDGINAESLPGDDNAFRISINLTLTQAYSRE